MLLKWFGTPFNVAAEKFGCTKLSTSWDGIFQVQWFYCFANGHSKCLRPSPILFLMIWFPPPIEGRYLNSFMLLKDFFQMLLNDFWQNVLHLQNMYSGSWMWSSHGLIHCRKISNFQWAAIQPGKINGRNRKITCLKTKLIFSKPSFFGFQPFIFRGVHGDGKSTATR